MTDLEQRLRDTLEDEARRAPAPHEARDGIRRARRRQVLTVVSSVASVFAVVAIVGLGIGALARSDGTVPADETIVTRSMHGVTITAPERWFVVDPDEFELNGPGPAQDLPRLVLVLAPNLDPMTLGCPGRVAGAGFLLTIQEAPTALNGPAARPWPVELEPLGVDNGDGAAGGCYSGFEFLHAGWTAEGRTFEARIGLATDISDDDREAVLAAYASMTFEPGVEQSLEWIVDQGTIGGQYWRVVASNDADDAGGPQLMIESNDGSSGIGYGGSNDGPIFTQVELGSGTDARVIVAGVVPGEVAELVVGDDVLPERMSVFDLPDRIDARNNAFLIVLRPEERVLVTAIDAEGNKVTTFTVPSPSNGQTDPPVPVEGDLEDGRHFGFIRAVDVGAGTIGLDLASWLSGEEANAAYHAAGGSGPVPNDHFIVNDDAVVSTLTLSPDLRLRLLDWNQCCDTFVDPGLPGFARAIETQSDVIDAGLRIRGQSQWWITVASGVVIEIEEQYSP